MNQKDSSNSKSKYEVDCRCQLNSNRTSNEIEFFAKWISKAYQFKC